MRKYPVWMQAAQAEMPQLFVACSECNTPVFQWNSTNTFDITVLEAAKERHETTWHTEQ